jgi:hypothetical protein
MTAPVIIPHCSVARTSYSETDGSVRDIHSIARISHGHHACLAPPPLLPPPTTCARQIIELRFNNGERFRELSCAENMSAIQVFCRWADTTGQCQPRVRQSRTLHDDARANELVSSAAPLFAPALHCCHSSRYLTSSPPFIMMARSPERLAVSTRPITLASYA